VQKNIIELTAFKFHGDTIKKIHIFTLQFSKKRSQRRFFPHFLIVFFTKKSIYYKTRYKKPLNQNDVEMNKGSRIEI